MGMIVLGSWNIQNSTWISNLKEWIEKSHAEKLIVGRDIQW